MKVELYKDSAGEYRWRKITGHDVVATSGEGYKNRSWAEHMARKENPGVHLVDMTDDHTEGS